VKEFRPTWYAASPVIHHSIIEEVRSDVSLQNVWTPRFVNSSGASSGEELHTLTREVLHTQLIQQYSISEFGNITSTPLSPAADKPGSAGVPISGDVAIMGEDGDMLPAGQTGEVVARPPLSVDYKDVEVDLAPDGWFHTGDLGYFDEDGYLFLRGRLKEVINRGGQKISPLEVEETLASHPGVHEVAVFGIPDTRLGEEVAAAVVPKADVAVSPHDIQSYAAARLSSHMVPRQVVFVERLPRNAGGKVPRNSLATVLGVVTSTRSTGTQPATDSAGQGTKALASPLAPARDQTEVEGGSYDVVEAKMRQLWAQALRKKIIGLHDDFFDLGGDSLRGVSLLAHVEEVFGVTLPLVSIFQAPTVAQMAELVRQKGVGINWRSLVALQPSGSRLPIYFVHGVWTGVTHFRPLAASLGQDQPVYAFQAQGLDGRDPPLDSIPVMAERYIDEMLAFQPEGPYHLVGYSSAGSWAMEMAQQLYDRGKQVGMVALLDSFYPRPTAVAAPFSLEGLARYWGYFNKQSLASKVAYLRYLGQRAIQSGYRVVLSLADRLHLGPAHPRLVRQIEKVHRRAMNLHRLGPYPGRVLLIRTPRPLRFTRATDPRDGWENLAGDGLTVRFVEGTHLSILEEPEVAAVAKVLTEYLDSIW
jgi:thioesterase domain-containing protein/acyl carrier protein